MNERRRQREGAPRRADARDGRRRHAAAQGARARARAQAEDRDERLLEQLREIYTSQGIVVTDEVLAQGVDALREERFAYPQPQPSFSRTLAHAYVTRGRWGKWAGGRRGACVAVAAIAFQLFVRGPELRQATEVPAELHGRVSRRSMRSPTIRPRSTPRARSSRRAKPPSRRATTTPRARPSAELETLNARLQPQYELRVVSRPGEQSGVWREPEVNRSARNYYLIVEAVRAERRAAATTDHERRGRPHARRVGVGLARRRSHVQPCRGRQARRRHHPRQRRRPEAPRRAWIASTRCRRPAPRSRSGKAMSLSGNDVLALIERTLTDTRSEIGNIDTRLARSTAELERLRQAEIGCLSVLARMRLREIEGADGCRRRSTRRARACASCSRSARSRRPRSDAEIARAEERRKRARAGARGAARRRRRGRAGARRGARRSAEGARGRRALSRGDGGGRRLGPRRGSRRGKGEGRAHGPRREGQAVRRRSAVLVSMGARLRYAGLRGRRTVRACSTAGWRASRTSSRCAATTGC